MRSTPRAQFEDEALGAWEPEAAYVNPVRTVYGLTDAARKRGATLRTGVAVTVVMVTDGIVRGVRTSEGETVDSEAVVNASGPWAGTLLQRLNLDYPLRAIRPE